MSPHATTVPQLNVHGTLQRDHGHRVSYSVQGARDGRPILLLHGGPGSGSSPGLARPLVPGLWRIVQFDQRGCGASTPLGGTRGNDTAALLSDIEALRHTLGLNRWLVAGGSWGSALALAYAARCGGHVSGLLLRNVFLTDGLETAHFFDAARERGVDMRAALARHGCTGDGLPAMLDDFFKSRNDLARLLHIASVWRDCDAVVTGSPRAPRPSPGSPEARALVGKYRVQAHYLARECFLGKPAVLAAAAAARNIPTAIIHGVQDPICSPDNARQVHAAMPNSRLTLVDGAGHDPFHPGMLAAMHQGLAELTRQAPVQSFPETRMTTTHNRCQSRYRPVGNPGQAEPS